MKKYRLSTTSRALLLTTAASLAVPAFAHGEAMLPAAAASTEPPAEEVASPDPDDQDYDDEEEIVVTGQRLAGQLDTDFTAAVELDEAPVASYGVSSVGELPAAIEPRTRSGPERGTDRPVPPPK